MILSDGLSPCPSITVPVDCFCQTDYLSMKTLLHWFSQTKNEVEKQTLAVDREKLHVSNFEISLMFYCPNTNAVSSTFELNFWFYTSRPCDNVFSFMPMWTSCFNSLPNIVLYETKSQVSSFFHLRFHEITVEILFCIFFHSICLTFNSSWILQFDFLQNKNNVSPSSNHLAGNLCSFFSYSRLWQLIW